MTKCECNTLDMMIFKCMDCNVCTDCSREYYMVTDEVWARANPKRAGMLCIGCIEARLGQLLTSAEFSDAPLNSMNLIMGSARLKSRLTNDAIPATF